MISFPLRGFPAVILIGLSVLAVAPASFAQEAGSSDASACSGDGNYAAGVLGFEGGGDPRATNPGSTATGSYQFLYGTLVNLGYIEPGQDKPPAGAGNWDGIRWTGKDGVYSRDQFMSSQSAQDNALAAFTNQNLAAISGSYSDGQVINGVPMTSGGAALAAHMLGSGGFNKWAASGFSPSGLDAGIAAAHGWTPEEYQNHLMKRVAAGGCFDPGLIESPSELVQDLPEIFLMPWDAAYQVPPILPGTS